MDGILPVYKPAGMTSYDVIRAFKRAVHPDYRIGHGGTLDPFADGVLLLLLGRATKRMNELSALPKTYRATACLGAKSDTLDRTGTILECHSATVSRVAVAAAAEQFVGEIEQRIPDYSAAKVNGIPRYKLARRGVVQPPKSKKVTIYRLEIVNVKHSNYSNNRSIEMIVSCSAGTYIRQLSYDLFRSVGVESYLESLTRTAIGNFSLAKCAKIDEFSESKWPDKVV